VEPCVAPGARPAHQEPARAVAQDRVRDELLPARVVLDGWLTDLDAAPPDPDAFRERLGSARRRLLADPRDGPVE
jgi:hypothetical protein